MDAIDQNKKPGESVKVGLVLREIESWSREDVGEFKAKLFETINQLIGPAEERKKELLNNPKRLDSIIDAGCDKARLEAQKTLLEVRDRMKFHSLGGL